jgi:hypothetical protein
MMPVRNNQLDQEGFFMKEASKLRFLTRREQGSTRELSDIKNAEFEKHNILLFTRNNSFVTLFHNTCVCSFSKHVSPEDI